MKQNSVTQRTKMILLFVLLLLLLHPIISIAQDIELADLDISMVLINQSDGTLRKLEEKNLELTSKKVALKKDVSIEEMLRSNGIYADAESIGVVYRLNPKADVESLSSSSELIIPKAKGGKEFSDALKMGYLVALTVDKDHKQYFLKLLKKLEVLVEQVSRS